VPGSETGLLEEEQRGVAWSALPSHSQGRQKSWEARGSKLVQPQPQPLPKS
jgi:hypothetical protein